MHVGGALFSANTDLGRRCALLVYKSTNVTKLIFVVRKKLSKFNALLQFHEAADRP